MSEREALLLKFDDLTRITIQYQNHDLNDRMNRFRDLLNRTLEQLELET